MSGRPPQQEGGPAPMGRPSKEAAEVKPTDFTSISQYFT